MKAVRTTGWRWIIGSMAVRPRRGAALTLIALLLALAGCQPRTQEQAKSTAAPLGGGTPTKQVVNLQITHAGCVDYSPPQTTLSLGDSIVWNSSADTVIVVHLPGLAFGDSVWNVTKQGKVSTGPALHAGSFYITAQPGVCSAPGGDTGPAIVINEGKP